MQQTKWLKKMSYTVATLGLLSIAQTAVSSPVLFDAKGLSKASQSAGAAKAEDPGMKLKSSANHTKSMQAYLDKMKIDFSQVKLADGRIRVTAIASSPHMPVPPMPVDYFWWAPSDSVDHYPESETEQKASSTFTFTMPAAQTEKYEFSLMATEKNNSEIYAYISDYVVPIESMQAYLDGLELNIVQTKLANGAIQVTVKTSNSTVQTSPKPLKFYWDAPSNSVDHHPATESEQSKSSTFTFTMPATQTEKYNLIVMGSEKENGKVNTLIEKSIVPIGSTQAYLDGLKLNVTQSKLPNGAIEVVAKATNPDMPTSPKPIKYIWEEPAGSSDYHPQSESERGASSTLTFTMPASQTEKYNFSLMGEDKENYNVYSYISAPITPLRSHQAFLNLLQSNDTLSTLKKKGIRASTGSIVDFVDGLKLDVTQDKLANGETRVVVNAINPYEPNPPTPLNYFWIAPKDSTEHHPISGSRTDLTTFEFTMPATKKDNYQFTITAYDKTTDKFIARIQTIITPPESTQAFLNGLTLDTTQTKLEGGATKVVVKANNPNTPTSPTPVEYYWRGPTGSTERHPITGERTKLSTFEFTMPSTQDEKYNFSVTGYEEGNDKVTYRHSTVIVPVGSTQSFLNGFMLHATQTKLESGATRVVVKASNPHEATPPMAVEYYWKKPRGSTDHNPAEKLTGSSTFEFTMPAEQTAKYSMSVMGYQTDKHSISSFKMISVDPILEATPY